jgi:hypothetical protein
LQIDPLVGQSAINLRKGEIGDILEQIS